jgi:peptidoglycan/xylan/chitin deacetylase (PgdA/CDA1 family)
MAENWAWVYVANIRGARGPQGPAGTGFKGTLPNNTDVNTLTKQTDSGFWHLSANNTYTGLPAGFSGAGQIEVSVTGASSGEHRLVRYGFPETYRRSIKNYFSTPKTFTDWELEKDRIIDVPSGANLDDYRTTGRYMVQNTTIATSLTGGWPTQIPRGPVYFEVEATVAGIVFQQMYSYGASHTALSRATVALTPTPYPFGGWKDLGAASSSTDPSNAGLANAVRLDDFSFRRGGSKKLPFGAGAVALRFDHGLNNFNTEARPLLEARNLKYLLALNSRGWSTAENDTVTAAMVDAWVAGGLCKIGNHGAHHNDCTTLAALQDCIVTGLAELKAQLPSASIDGWFVPGVGGTNYNGFNGGQTPEAFYNTDAGRLILENHAVSSGAFPNTAQRVLDGRPRQGMGHFTMDTSTVAAITAQIDAAITNKTGLQLMCHPSLLNTAGNITTANLTTVLDYLVTKQTAGDLVVLDPYELLLADAR